MGFGGIEEDGLWLAATRSAMIRLFGARVMRGVALPCTLL